MTTIKLFKNNSNQLKIRDTKIHSYKTDEIYMINIMDTIPDIVGAGVFLFNNLNENLSATLVTNVMEDGSFPDSLSTTTTISAGQSAFLTLPSEELIANFFSVELQCNIAPTTGYVEGFALVKYAYRST